MLVDSHCHLDMLDLDAYGGDIANVLAEAEAAGVDEFLCVSVSTEAYPAMRALVDAWEQVSFSVGVHPNHRDDAMPSVDELVALADDERVVAIGETGLDYFRSDGDVEWQRERFRAHIRASGKSGKPLIIHTRAAREDTLQIMREEHAGETGGVMHCFTEDLDMARAALDMNFYISFSGIVTFKNAADLQEVARQVPMERMLVETDSPYLAPVPYRGKPNCPAYVRQVAEFIAGLRDIPLAELARQTTANYHTLFG